LVICEGGEVCHLKEDVDCDFGEHDEDWDYQLQVILFVLCTTRCMRAPVRCQIDDIVGSYDIGLKQQDHQSSEEDERNGCYEGFSCLEEHIEQLGEQTRYHAGDSFIVVEDEDVPFYVFILENHEVTGIRRSGPQDYQAQ